MTKKRTLIGAAILLPLVAWLAFGFFGVQTLFIEDRVDEAGPVFASETSVAPEPATEDPEAVQEAEVVAEEAEEEAMPTEEPSPAEEPAPETAEVTTVLQGSFIDRIHPAVGTASVLSDGSDQRFLRFEDFETDNGPDLFVYLTTEDAAGDNDQFGADGEFIDLGVLKGNVGDQNYEIPTDVDLDKYNTVVIWCRRFGVAFGAADLI